jgi:HD-GYP domain-containing protein (c-di-GMP phosphodiesterase class II)
MVSRESSILFGKQGQAIESISGNGLHISLLASGDGVEIIHHRLDAGSRWAITPADGWTGLEFVYILGGNLIYKEQEEEIHLSAGDRITVEDIRIHAYFLAKTETEFLYVSSKPVFHSYRDTVKKLSELATSVGEKDGYTTDHCQRIMNMALSIGEKMNLPSTQLHLLSIAAFFHDVGKVRITESILNKPGKLNVDEWATMRLHPIYGRSILEETGLPLMAAAGRIVEQHHERYDCQGYPYGLGGEDIHICAAIISVVDSYHAIISDRVYRKGRSKAAALAEIQRCRGTMYHPDVVDVFLSIVDTL